MIKCKYCGQMVEDSATTCPTCGQPVERPAASSSNPQQTSTPPNYNQPNNGQQAPNYQQAPGYQQRPNYQQQAGGYNYQQQQQRQRIVTAPNGMPMRNLEVLEACKMFWTRYVDFEGRSRRAEFWWSYLMVFLISTFLGWTVIAPLACIIPMIAVSVRRLHDIGKSGWYYLVFLVPVVGTILMIIWGCQEGMVGRNQYGDDPKYLV